MRSFRSEEYSSALASTAAPYCSVGANRRRSPLLLQYRRPRGFADTAVLGLQRSIVRRECLSATQNLNVCWRTKRMLASATIGCPVGCYPSWTKRRYEQHASFARKRGARSSATGSSIPTIDGASVSSLRGAPASNRHPDLPFFLDMSIWPLRFRHGNETVDAFRWPGDDTQCEEPQWAVDALSLGTMRIERGGRRGVQLLVMTTLGWP